MFFLPLKKVFDSIKAKIQSKIYIGNKIAYVTKNNTVNGNVNVYATTSPNEAVLSPFELRILSILAEGGKARYSLGEDGNWEQINIFGHPDQNDIAPNSEETLAAFRTLLKYRLLDDDPAEHLYQCSAEGRNALAAGTLTVSWKR